MLIIFFNISSLAASFFVFSFVSFSSYFLLSFSPYADDAAFRHDIVFFAALMPLFSLWLRWFIFAYFRLSPSADDYIVLIFSLTLSPRHYDICAFRHFDIFRYHWFSAISILFFTLSLLIFASFAFAAILPHCLRFLMLYWCQAITPFLSPPCRHWCFRYAGWCWLSLFSSLRCRHISNIAAITPIHAMLRHWYAYWYAWYAWLFSPLRRRYFLAISLSLIFSLYFLDVSSPRHYLLILASCHWLIFMAFAIYIDIIFRITPFITPIRFQLAAFMPHFTVITSWLSTYATAIWYAMVLSWLAFCCHYWLLRCSLPLIRHFSSLAHWYLRRHWFLLSFLIFAAIISVSYGCFSLIVYRRSAYAIIFSPVMPRQLRADYCFEISWYATLMMRLRWVAAFITLRWHFRYCRYAFTLYYAITLR